MSRMALLTCVLYALLLALVCHATPAADKDYEIVSTKVSSFPNSWCVCFPSLSLFPYVSIAEGDSDVVVVRRNRVIYMLYDETIIGAEFDDDDYRWQTAYPGFAIMQSAAYLDRKFTHAAQIGLGIGTVPTFLRGKGIPTDVIEISDAVVTQAANYFQYERCEDDDPEDCVNGKTFVADGLAFLRQEPKSEADKYDLFITDVYTGWNPLVFFTQEVMVSVRDKWLASPKSVFVCNFVGMFNGPHAVVPKSIYRTLQSVFKHVKAFREMDNADDDEGSNIVFFASNEPFEFSVPTHGDFKDPIKNTFFYIFKDLDAPVEVEVQQTVGAEEVTFAATDAATASTSARARILTEADHGQDEFKETHSYTQAHMRQRVVDQFPASYWEDVKQLHAKKTQKKAKEAEKTEESAP
ncbi:hypothetical protein FI667_g3504, partial [Globisporangium splendens]